MNFNWLRETPPSMTRIHVVCCQCPRISDPTNRDFFQLNFSKDDEKIG